MAQCATFRGELRATGLAALFALVPLMAAQPERAPERSVTAVRHWVLSSATRIAIEVSGEFTFRSDRLHNPERVYFDIQNARPNFGSKRLYSQALTGPMAQRIRVAETQPGVTRVVIDLADEAEVQTSMLSNPHRLIVELRKKGAAGRASEQIAKKGAGETAPGTAPLTQIEKDSMAALVTSASPSKAAEPEIPISRPVAPSVRPAASIPKPASKEPLDAAASSAKAAEPEVPGVKAAASGSKPMGLGVQGAASNRKTPALAEKASNNAPASAESAAKPSAPEVPSPQPLVPSPQTATPEEARAMAPAKRTSLGESSLVRTLGLKLSKVVIDAGHGGHDQGTESEHGLLEKDLVLDVALRLGKLVEDRLGAEVVYTRSDDTFVPLGERTALANDKKADLFLSIHANSSPSAPRVAGIETFYLNITGTKDAMDVAARENAASDKSVFELSDLIQKIAKHDKAEESREFANRIQTALYAFSARNVPNEKNRGVKSAPFVVLIGANMPSVLVEIGFLSNSREESLLKKGDYRQKLAEALYRGVSHYADSLSHFETAAAKNTK